jgi:hypothetical protein
MKGIYFDRRVLEKANRVSDVTCCRKFVKLKVIKCRMLSYKLYFRR